MTLLSLEGAELACMRLCINIKGAAQSTFFVSSFDGELVYADWMRPEVRSTAICLLGLLRALVCFQVLCQLPRKALPCHACGGSGRLHVCHSTRLVMSTAQQPPWLLPGEEHPTALHTSLAAPIGRWVLSH